ncbi:uncharacterized protein [Pseudorasbora parva]|uniref:uncharacterized protein n=1 Tax=Pseudorasbora parva TaxID=51549 RepID=UPI00351E38D4
MRTQGQLVGSSEVALEALSPKLKCGDNLIKLQLNGPEVTQVELSRDNGAPVSLTKLPLHCGQTTPTNGGLVYATPYDGCGVIQQGGRYVVRIQWKGNSAVVSCPMLSSTTENEPFRGPNPPTYVQILQYHPPPDTLSSAADPMPEPSTSETGKESTSTSQEMPKPQPLDYSQAFPQRLWPYYDPHYHYPGRVYPIAKPTALPTIPTVIQALTQKDPGYSQDFWPNYYPYYHHGRPKPKEKRVPTSMSTSVAQAPTEKPQHQGYTQGFRPNYYPNYHHHVRPKSREKPVPTSMPTTRSVAQAPIQKPKRLRYPEGFRPNYYPHDKPKPPKKPDTVIPDTSPPSSPKRIPPYNTYPNYPLYLQQLYSQYPIQHS